jgi:hypothetical protein
MREILGGVPASDKPKLAQDVVAHEIVPPSETWRVREIVVVR